jgi:hypothetical protein
MDLDMEYTAGDMQIERESTDTPYMPTWHVEFSIESFTSYIAIATY